jgi:acylphosphatase
MKAFTIVLKGNSHKIGFRHCLIAEAKKSDIQGYINYRRHGEELFLHIEGEKGAISTYMTWLQNLVSQSQLEMYYQPAAYRECQDFKIACDSLLFEDVSTEGYLKADVVETVVETIVETSVYEELEQPVRVPVSGWNRIPFRAGVNRIIGRMKHAGLF